MTSGEPLRVLYVDHAQALGGAERSLLLLLQHLDPARTAPVLACNPGPLERAARDLGIQVAEVPMPRLRRELAAPLRFARGVGALCRLIRSQQIDLVHANVMRASLYAALAARLTRRPLVWHVRDIFAPGLYVQAMSQLAACAIAISQVTAHPLTSQVSVVRVPNGVDLDAFDAELGGGQALRTEWGVPESAPLVGLVARLQPWKGQTDFVQAMAEVARACPEARFVLVGGAIFGGDGAYEAGLRALAERLGLAARLIFAGHRQDLGAVLSALDVLVHCSSEPEPFGRIIIEGLAARLPLVAYDRGGPGEILTHGETGLLVAPGDVSALAAGVVSLLEDSSLRQRLGATGRALVERDYRAEAVARRIETVYAALSVRRVREG